MPTYDRYRPHHPMELERLLEWADGSKRILEIGSRFGHVLADMARRCKADLVVSVDWPAQGLWGDGMSEPVLKENIRQLQEEGIAAHLFLGDSKELGIIKAVREFAPFDFIFIDADHAYEGVKADWENYGHMGRQVVFHDIKQIDEHGGYNQCNVCFLWNDLTRIHPAQWTLESYIARGSVMGIGRVIRDAMDKGLLARVAEGIVNYTGTSIKSDAVLV